MFGKKKADKNMFEQTSIQANSWYTGKVVILGKKVINWLITRWLNSQQVVHQSTQLQIEFGLYRNVHGQTKNESFACFWI